MSGMNKKKKPRRMITPQKGTSFGDRIRAAFGAGSDARLERLEKQRKKRQRR